MTKIEFAQLFNTWLQSAAIFFGALWVLVYTVGYNEVYKSKTAPAHVTASLRVDVEQPTNGFVPVSVAMEVENESDQDVHILPGVFLAIASELVEVVWEAEEYLKHMENAANQFEDKLQGRFLKPTNAQVVAGGSVFTGLLLSPKESASKTYLFHLPVNKYDVVEVVLNFWAHKGAEDLSSLISFPSENAFRNEPCVFKEAGRDKMSCDVIPLDEENREKREALDLDEFESRVQAAIPRWKPGTY